MNERIKEFAVQAGFSPELNWDHTVWHAIGHSEWFERFAELIVKECIEVSQLGSISESKLKKHFGVK